ncbi:hypothetical protein [Haliangium sp.]|uniref:STAS domain-containing protein n=1 Tax=Haliangium sp. TaxID=2663208 RepID=UPI003D0EFB32
MSQKFQAAVHHRDDVTFVKLSGVIDEDNELTDLTEKIPAGTAVIDLGEVERINSCGVRDWVNWLSQIEAHGASVVLVECSPAIVAQINLVNNFTGAGIVKSFYVPYFCPECDEEKVLLVESADMGPPPHEPPVCRCDECDLVMDFDDMPDSYFAFLSNPKHLNPPENLNESLGEMPSGDVERSRIRARAGTGNVTGRGSVTSLPSVPSLPSISLPGAPVPQTGPHHSPFTNPGSGVTNPSAVGLSQPPPPPVASKSGALVYVLIGVLVAAISVLAVLLFGSEL